MTRILGLLLCAACAAACAGSGRMASFPPSFEGGLAAGTEPLVSPTPAGEPAQEHDGSLFQPSSGGWSMWRDDTASQVGDIITVRVQVNTTAQKKASTALSRESGIKAGIESLFGLESSLPGVGSVDPLNGTKAAQLIKADSSSSFQGDGDTARTDKVVADVSALVTHVYPNGNMRIHGSQGLLINNENSLLTVDGLIRPGDVAYDNIVASNRIAECRIEMTGRGVISDKQRPGLVSRAFDWLWPL